MRAALLKLVFVALSFRAVPAASVDQEALQNLRPEVITRPSVLLMTVSNAGHASSWPLLAKWGQSTGADDMVVLSGRPLLEKFTLESILVANVSIRMLYVNASDGYLGLTQKMLLAWHAVARLPQLLHVTHVIKVDDSDVLSGAWDRFNAAKLQQLLYSQTQAVAHYGGRRLKTLPPSKGPARRMWILHMCCSTHAGELDKLNEASQFWRQKALRQRMWTCSPFGWPATTFADGGSGYLLSRHAVHLVTDLWRLGDVDKVMRTFGGAEDIALATALHQQSVKVSKLKFPGMPSVTGWHDDPYEGIRIPELNNSTCTRLLEDPTVWSPWPDSSCAYISKDNDPSCVESLC